MARGPTTLSEEFIQESESSGDEVSTARSEGNDDTEPAPTTANIDEPIAPAKKRKNDQHENSQQGQKRKRSNSQTTPNTARIPSKPFSAPRDYTLLDSKTPNQQPNPQLQSSKLAKKQVWYFTAPKSLDLESLTEIDFNAAITGSSLLDQNGVSYHLSEKTAHDTTLLQLAKNRRFREGKHNITKTYHVYTATRPPKAENSTSDNRLSFTAVSTGTAAKPRAQPEGLRMRYQPFGPAAVSLYPVRAEKRPPMTAVESRVKETNGKMEDRASSMVPETPPKKRTKIVDSADQSLRNKVVTVDQVENGSPTKVRKKKKKKSAIPGEITV